MKRPPRRFFWLLFWSGVGLILLNAASYCISSVVWATILNHSTLPIIKEIQGALNGFKTEYERYPLSAERPLDDDLIVDSANSNFIGSISGDDLRDNPREIRFIGGLPISKNGKGGLMMGNGRYGRLLDDWGRPYMIILDANQDQEVRNPDRLNTDPKIQSAAPEWLSVPVAIYSCGFDGTPHTADDITSWRTPPPAPSEFKLGPRVNVLVSLIFICVGVAGIITSPRTPTSKPLPE